MNKRIDFSILGGFPAVQETFGWMQDSYRAAFAALATMFGNKVILHGCQIVGGNVTNGWVSINGELMPFVGAAYAAGAEVIIVETAGDPVIFQDNSSHTVYFEKYATIGGPGGFPFTDLKQPNIGVPVGTIVMWSGAVNAIPAGWALCDGAGGTPNLKGKFIVGYDPDDPDYDTIGKTGGAKTTTLQKTNLPNVRIDVPIPATDTSLGPEGSGKITTGNTGNEPIPGPTLKTAPLGDGTPMDRRGPFYTLAYIIKL